MESNTVQNPVMISGTESAPMPSTTQSEPKKNNNKGILIDLIVCILLATIGGVFGIVEMMDANAKATEVANLKSQLADKDSTITTLETEKSELNDKYDALIAANQSASKDEDDGVLRIISIGDCTGDQAYDPETHQNSGVYTLKCDAVSTNGAGKFYYNSDTNILKFVQSETNKE